MSFGLLLTHFRKTFLKKGTGGGEAGKAKRTTPYSRAEEAKLGFGAAVFARIIVPCCQTKRLGTDHPGPALLATLTTKSAL